MVWAKKMGHKATALAKNKRINRGVLPFIKQWNSR